MKLILYLRFGMGDWYNLLAMLPAIMRERKITNNDLKLYIDCIYFYDDKFKAEKETAIKMMELFTKNWEIVPKELSSCDNLYISVEDNEKTFLPFAKQSTRDYIKSKLEKDDIFIYGYMGIYFYEWKDEKNVPINYKKEQLKFNHNQIKTILIQVRKKGNGVDSYFYAKLLDYCVNNKIRCVLIGNKDEMNVNDNKYIIDLRNKLDTEELFEYVDNFQYMIGSSSVFAYHRLFTNSPTIFLVPIETGTAIKAPVFEQKDGENLNYLFLNSDNDCIDKVIAKVGEWFK